ncbi:MAG: CCA tRNA nucleotidyltransferase [Alphaproteobacteria bacterium]|nr:MAG: CCA tRNA nucleotidyltransferase [Alphaproteobacteria bacterium]
MTDRRLDPERAPWLVSKEVRALFAALGAENARIVGGAVRDALLGRPLPHELDIACRLPPEESVRRLEKAGFRTIPTGLSHGTISVAGRDWFYEITTLRIDVETDGRHARVAFTDDWQADASRRDFTMNAIYCDLEGRLSDFFGGIRDALEGRVRFIGDPRRRIEEDALRILRFFRFHAHYGRGRPDEEGLAACAEMRDRLTRLSIERVRDELLKLLAAPDPGEALTAMEETGILPLVLPRRAGEWAKHLAQLVLIERIFTDEQALGKEDDDQCALRRLAALLAPMSEEGCRHEARRLKLSRRQMRRLARLALPLVGHDARTLRRAIHADGIDLTRDRLLLALARSGTHGQEAAILAREWRDLSKSPPPPFPLKGADLITLGLTPGPEIGKLLTRLEDEWIAEDFRASRTELLARAKAVLSAQATARRTEAEDHG